MEKKKSFISGKEFPLDDLSSFASIRKPLLHLILKDHPDFGPGKYITNAELNHYRSQYLESMLRSEHKELNHLEKVVLQSIEEKKILSENLEPEMSSNLTYGAKLADKIATFGGSWTFITFFFSFLLIWMFINIWTLQAKAFDPYPFILLNLILSCLAAIQAPIIMMSQNRQEEKDRIRNEHDYMVNLKAELEIRLLHEKIDHLMVHQNKRLLEVQELQLDYLNQIIEGLHDK
ncbi:MAG: DUF1003 domain-containing protein [Bacteroidetes bacterium]|nr:DUF1003 domain-containing protein [Bacteroidota bacterium]